MLSCNSDKPDTIKLDDNKYQPPASQSTPYQPPKHYRSKVNDDEDDDDNTDKDEDSNKIEDDTYDADVEYYNPNTGTRSSYTLEVEVENNRVTVINFPKGGWLDDVHIVSGGELDSDGSTRIYTDKGYEFSITINR